MAGVTPLARLVRAKKSVSSAGAMSTAPARSKRSRSTGRASRGSVLRPTANATMPTGTLMRKIDSHG